MIPTLIACSHGTSSARGREAIRSILDDVRCLRPELTVVEAFVDVQTPTIDDVVIEVTAQGSAIVVPLLLSTGYHTRVDIGRAVSRAGGRAIAAPTLGPHPLLIDILWDRLDELGGGVGAEIVLAAAGSSDPQAAVDVCSMATTFSSRLDREVRVGFAASTVPRLDDAVSTARSVQADVIALSYVLAPGYFADVISRTDVDGVTAPLAPDPRIARVVLERYDAAQDQFPLLAERTT